MDVVTAASGLRNKLIVVDTTQKQLELLNEEITAVSQQSFISDINGNSARTLQLSIRLSVLKGVQHVYKQISDTKWNQVKSTALSIMSELQNIDDPRVPTTSPATQTYTSTDKTAASWSRSFCDYYRDN